ncbi:MAG: hypothetical protein IPK10_18580 [Bacteroidetes bacterium]|nr:hypothetical protein [Bacteroidota bacterium]
MLNSEVNYQIFTNEKEDEAIGKLHATNVKLNEIGTTSNSLQANIISARQVIKMASDSIKYIDSLLLINSTTNLLIQKENLIGKITEQREFLSNTGYQIKSNDFNILLIATNENNAANPSQLPDANEKFMNEITIGYKQFGLPFLISNYETILQIAIQCPYSGGRVLALHVRSSIC